MWRIIESGSLPPASIMAKDQDLLHQLEQSDGNPILHFYDWEGECLTYGYFTHPSDHLNLAALEKWQIKSARRPTGGGIIFHLTDFAFSLLLPSCHPAFSMNTLDNYAFVNQKVAEAIRLFSSGQVQPDLYKQEEVCEKNSCLPFCMAKPTQYDLIINHKKVGGAAQRRTKWGFLHQGSISLASPPLDLLNAVLKEDVVAAMQHHTHPLLGNNWTADQLAAARQDLKSLLKKVIIG